MDFSNLNFSQDRPPLVPIGQYQMLTLEASFLLSSNSSTVEEIENGVLEISNRNHHWLLHVCKSLLRLF